MTPTFSILMPTRRRPDDAVRAVESLRSHAVRPDAVEYLLRFDSDDRASYDAVRAQGGTHVRAFIGRRYGYRGMHHYYNLLARKARGAFLVAWNDDAQMVSDGWDEMVEAAAEPVCVVAQEHTHPFPFVSRGAYVAVGNRYARGYSVDSLWEHAARAAECLKPIGLSVTHDYQRNDEIKQDNAAYKLEDYEGQSAYELAWADEWGALLRRARG